MTRAVITMFIGLLGLATLFNQVEWTNITVALMLFTIAALVLVEIIPADSDDDLHTDNWIKSLKETKKDA